MQLKHGETCIVQRAHTFALKLNEASKVLTWTGEFSTGFLDRIVSIFSASQLRHGWALQEHRLEMDVLSGLGQGWLSCFFFLLSLQYASLSHSYTQLAHEISNARLHCWIPHEDKVDSKRERERVRQSWAKRTENMIAKHCKQSSFQTMATQRALVHSAATGELHSTVEACWKVYGMGLWSLCLAALTTATEECLKSWSFETLWNKIWGLVLETGLVVPMIFLDRKWPSEVLPLESTVADLIKDRQRCRP